MDRLLQVIEVRVAWNLSLVSTNNLIVSPTFLPPVLKGLREAGCRSFYEPLFGLRRF